MFVEYVMEVFDFVVNFDCVDCNNGFFFVSLDCFYSFFDFFFGGGNWNVESVFVFF